MSLKFYIYLLLINGSVAQSAEQYTFNVWVAGSIPATPTNGFSNSLWSLDYELLLKLFFLNF